MDLYLMQHGEAVAAEVDPDRPLAPGGSAHVAAVAAHAAACGVRVDRVVHSGKTRAAQTAGILAGALGCSDVVAVDGLKPNDDVASAVRRLVDPSAPGSLAVVGHLPFLDRLASLLVTGDPAAHVVAFRNAGLVRLVPDESGAGFAVAWALTPELVPAVRA
jgi:phosphohistidine phosphatase